MNKKIKTMAGVTLAAGTGILAYAIFNKNVRKKCMELKDVMVDETKDMLKK